eukprot:SAG22_NODE_645_length_8202_cov_5.985684_1_plen_288_part_10
MFMATCPAGLPADDCIPLCEEATNGFLLLLNVNGEDTKLTCELHHGFFSWLGGASDGGCIGDDVAACSSSINSGAAGNYVLRLLASAVGAASLILMSEQNLVVHNGAASSRAVVWSQTLPVPAFDFHPQSSGSFVDLSFQTATTAPVMQIGADAIVRVADCGFTQLGGSGIVLSGGGTVSVARSSFANLCSHCFAIDASDPASLVTMQQLTVADRPLSQAVGFSICVHSVDMELSDANKTGNRGFGRSLNFGRRPRLSSKSRFDQRPADHSSSTLAGTGVYMLCTQCR